MHPWDMLDLCAIIRTSPASKGVSLMVLYDNSYKCPHTCLLPVSCTPILYEDSYKGHRGNSQFGDFVRKFIQKLPRRSYLDVFVRNFVQALPPKGPTRWFYTVFRTNALTHASFTLVLYEISYKRRCRRCRLKYAISKTVSPNRADGFYISKT